MQPSPKAGLEALPELHIARRTATKRSRPRLQSCFAKSGCDAFSWRCSTDGDCLWDASFRSRGPRRCRRANHRPSNVAPYRQHLPLLRLPRRLYDKNPSCEGGVATEKATDMEDVTHHTQH